MTAMGREKHSAGEARTGNLGGCHDCGTPTDAGPCPGCGLVYCLPCAEKPYAFCDCTDGAEDPKP